MPIQTACPHCSREYTLADNMEGKTVRCKACSQAFTIAGATPPAPKSAPKQAVKPTAPQPTARSSPAAPRTGGTTLKNKAAEDDILDVLPGDPDPGAEDEVPPRERGGQAKKGGIPLWVWLVGAGAGLFLCCGGTAGVGGLIYALSGSSGSGQITEANFNKISNGMSEAEVNKLLGTPTNSTGAFGFKTSTWQDKDNVIQVTFTNDRVTLVSATINGKKLGSLGGFPNPGGTGKVNRTNFNRINNGMSENEVIAILGQPTVRGPNVGGATTHAWTEGFTSISVTFQNGRVSNKSSNGL